MATGWGVDGWGDNTWGGSQDALTGVTASGEVGTVLQSGAVALVGVEASGNVGSVSVADRSIALTGVEASGDVNVPAVIVCEPKV